VSATIVVLVAAGLFVRAVIHGFGGGPGFDVDQTVYVQVQVVPPFLSSGTDFNAPDDTIAENTRRLKEALRSLPGVEDVALGPSPIGPDPASFVLAPKTVEIRDQRRELRVGVLTGSPELLAALGVPILRGRPLTSEDASVNPRPAVLTASLARTLWPANDPLGQVLSLGFRQCTCTVVGIVADFVYGSLTQESAGVVVTVNAKAARGMEPRFVVRTRRPDMLVQPIRKLVTDVVPDAARLVVSTGREIVAQDLGRQRLGAWFFSGFGLVALMLGAGGVFGLVAYLAESRRREFGVRLAVGAMPRDLVCSGVAAGLVPVSIGAAIGLLLSALIAGAFVSWLPGLSALDPLTYASVAIVMVGSAATASLAAAWRLRRIMPCDALRVE
jgi:MacB-like periplasmic core domain